MELVFNKVFTAEGEKNGKAWKRWDYKTADGQRYVSFKTGSIPLETSVLIELSGDNKIESWKASGTASAAASEPVQNEQSTLNGWSKDDQIHAQCATQVAAELLRYFEKDEQTLATFWTLTASLKSYYDSGDSVIF